MFGALIIWDLFLPLMVIHILVTVDYVTKWLEAIPTSSADHNTSIKMLKEVMMSTWVHHTRHFRKVHNLARNNY